MVGQERSISSVVGFFEFTGSQVDGDRVSW